MAELHIAGCVAFATPESTPRVVDAIGRSGLAEVPRHDERGRLVILIEKQSSAAVLDVIDAIRALEGVLAVHIAYQHTEEENDLEEPQ